MSQTANAFDIKSASLDVLALILKTARLDELTAALDARFGTSNGVQGLAEAFVLDLESLPRPAELDLATLLPLLEKYGIRALGLRHPDHALATLAARHGLAYHNGANSARGTVTQDAAPAAAPAPMTEAAGTLIVERPVRAGQQIYARGSDLVVLAMVSAGAEVIADGNIHVYAPLRGRALAGARGNTGARIFVRSMEAELVSIAGVYRTLEQALPDSIKGKPTQVFLENERLVMQALGE
ncbi:septum site-determining protein MinC [Paludibacterium yongneupense]|uniref:septum site-determining protein MinC n=1 Tax=Paludibacterium yongneupense TaxID=400061 RepID=UPI000419260E|nr:septum site-determining protein MinC [Paludibacterium yongneupense]